METLFVKVFHVKAKKKIMSSFYCVEYKNFNRVKRAHMVNRKSMFALKRKLLRFLLPVEVIDICTQKRTET